MDKQWLRAYRQESEGDAEGPMTFVASTAGEKRDGLTIDQGKWSLENYQRNPVVLWAHDYTSRPLGRADVSVEDGQLMARVTWNEGNPQAKDVVADYRNGFLSAVSVGWRDVMDGDDVDAHELLDISAVPVPGDPDALKVDQARALRALADELLDVTTGDEANGFMTWDDVAAGMVDALTPRGGEPEDARRRRYNALLDQYKHHGRWAPEWMGDDELLALGVEEWRGLFLEGEVDELNEHLRAGAVLSRANLDDVEEIARLAQRILERAQRPEPEQAETNDDDERVAAPQWMRDVADALTPKDEQDNE